MDEFSHIIKKMTSTPSADLPAAFTEKVMAHVMREPAGLWHRLACSLTFPRKSMPSSTGILSTLSSKEECSFCYLLAGIFLAVMGGTALLGLNGLNNLQPITGWIKIQPFFIIATALWLFCLGTILYLSGRKAAPFVKVGALIFIAAFIMNGLLSQGISSLFMSSVTVMLTAAGAIMGLILYQNVSNYLNNLNDGGI